MRRRCGRRLWLVALAVSFLPSCASRPRGGAADELRVLVYNIHAGKDAAGVDNLERVAAVVRTTRADVVLLQEVDRGTRRSGEVDQPAVLAKATGYVAAFGKTLDYDGGEYGIAVLSRWPIVRQSVERLPVDPPQERAGGSYEPRGALHVTVARPGGAFDVVNTHLDASRDDRYRRQEAGAIVALARAVTTRVLVGGDFNSTPESAVQTAIRSSGLRDAWSECGRSSALTYPADTPTKRIDYLYLGAGERCTDAVVVETTASDHRPLLVTVRLR